MNDMLWFASDYMEGAHPQILRRLEEINLHHHAGYGLDVLSDAAREKIRTACACPDAEIHFLAGGTQTNAVVLGAMLRPYQGVIAASSGHVAVHEAGAIEAGGHKVLPLPHADGKIAARQIDETACAFLRDENHEHMVMPGMVYLSQPTEYGTLYSLSELEAISAVCRRHGLGLYVDGARLAYALACPANDVTLADLARLCDAFYIGGTKCGALFGEAVVFPKPGTVPHFFSIVKLRGALLAKGFITGLQFDTLFTDGLYASLGKNAVAAADRIRSALTRCGYKLRYGSPTNQVFFEADEQQLAALSERVHMSYIEAAPEGRTVMRLCTSWATTEEEVDALEAALTACAK